jgi:ataxin-10
VFAVFVVLPGTIYVPGIRSFLSFFNLDSFQNSTIEHHCTHACSHIARFPILTPFCREDEPVSPTQTILLKLLDSFLNPIPTPFRGRHDHLDNLTGFLASIFLFQAKRAQHVIQNATGEPPPGENIVTDVGGVASCALDGRFPGVWVALVLLSTSLSSILLAEQEDHSGTNTEPGVVTLTHLCHDTTSASRSRTGTGFIEELVGMMVPRSASYLLQRQSFAPTLETLRLLDLFLPRINFGRQVRSTPKGKEAVSQPVPGEKKADASDFPYLKRDLVRLLGILCHNRKAIQDRIRVCGGISVVLNLCTIDDRNPCKLPFSVALARMLP